MKNLNKLLINPDRLMSSDELMALNGGNVGQGACCMCYGLYGIICMGAIAATDQ
jgi:hypothetical protein